MWQNSPARILENRIVRNAIITLLHRNTTFIENIIEEITPLFHNKMVFKACQFRNIIVETRRKPPTSVSEW